MSLLRKFDRFVSVTLSLLIVSLTFAPLVGAQSQNQGGSGVQITPTRTELSLLPGEVKEFSVSVKNVTKGPITVKAFFNDFESDNTTGEPKIIIDKNRQLPNSMRSWVKGINDFDLKAGETKNVKLSVDAPAKASPGGYYGVVRFAAVPQGSDDDGNTQVSLTASVASLLLVEVSGDIKEQIQVSSLSAVDKKNKPSSIFFKPPTGVAVAISNKGNGFARPFGRVSVSVGGKEVYAYEMNNKEPRGIVLPGSSRTFTDEIKNINKIGRYTVSASVSYGQGGEVIVKKASFWVIPVWLIVVLVGLIAAVAAGLFVTYRRMGQKQRPKK